MVTRLHLLRGVRTKIDRAKVHIAEFEKLEESYVKNDSYRIVEKIDPTSGNKLFLITMGGNPSPEISAVVGDAIHNLRSALDHLACALIRLRNPRHLCIGNAIQFPIGKNVGDFKSKLRTYTDKAGTQTTGVFNAIKPYPRGKGKTLFRNHALDIKDKHRLLLLIGKPKLTRLDVTINKGVPNRSVKPDDVIISMASLSRQDGTALYIPKGGRRITHLTPRNAAYYSNFEVTLRPTGHIAFSEPGPLDGEAVIQTLVHFVDAVEETLEKFVPFFE